MYIELIRSVNIKRLGKFRKKFLVYLYLSILLRVIKSK